MNEGDFRVRVTECEDKKKRKIQVMQDNIKDKDLEGCTFHPEIYSVEDGYQKRPFDKFLEDQQQFQARVTKKNEDFKSKTIELEVSTMRPSIDSTS